GPRPTTSRPPRCRGPAPRPGRRGHRPSGSGCRCLPRGPLPAPCHVSSSRRGGPCRGPNRLIHHGETPSDMTRSPVQHVPASSLMRAVRLPRHGGAEVLEHVTVPVPTPGPDEVLVEVAAVALNNTDVWTREGAYGLPGDPTALAGWRGPITFP